MDGYREANRALWNAWTRVNLQSAMYDVEAFVAARARDLDPISRAGPGDVRGKSLLHLQCHFGMDTIRWARHGATVTGVDFSELPAKLVDAHPFGCTRSRTSSTRSLVPGSASPGSTSTRSSRGASFRGWSRAPTAGGGCRRTRACPSDAVACPSCSR